MQRKPTKNTPGPNALEKKLMAWTREQKCIICHQEPPSIVDHMYGSCFKNNKLLIGHLALLPYCWDCDQVKTIKGRKEHDRRFGKTQAQLFADHIVRFVIAGNYVPKDLIDAIRDWGR